MNRLFYCWPLLWIFGCGGEFSDHSLAPVAQQSVADRIDVSYREDAQAAFGDSYPVAASQETTPQPTEASRGGFINSLKSLVEGSPVYEDEDVRDGLIQRLEQAEQDLRDIRASDRRAIANASRQIRIGRAQHSPNLVLVTLPTLHFSELERMPRLAGIRNSGMLLTDCYVSAANYSVARSELLTGRFSANSSAYQNEMNLAETIWQSGYETSLIGVWPFESHPLESGFDQWTGFASPNGLIPEFPEALFTQLTRAEIISNRRDGNDGQERINGIQILTDEAVAFFNQQKNSARPLFVHIALPTLEGLERDEMLIEYNSSIGEIVDSLNETGFSGKTCLIVTGMTSNREDMEDEFESVGTLTSSASGLNEGNLRTPMIVFWGTAVARGSVNSSPCSVVDLLPTLAEIGVAKRRPNGLSGQSLLPALRNETIGAQRLFYWRNSDGGQAARRGPWKVIVPAGENQMMLFHLPDDPAEVVDVSAEYPSILKQFLAPPAQQELVEELF
ncbi:Sulfatase [Thalassoglobus neptunius]|uniref:Sulfatase n=1 Tax=Thalassoglobus neptunius TaxID=1938619 RepID=A0A5C5WLU6_9PLAN|nr:sulfatase-like hydrolase/transferase [Thalassoglobus neptunius]TWT51587.1 Sulfatase [Thalassoglobus neptunius]